MKMENENAMRNCAKKISNQIIMNKNDIFTTTGWLLTFIHWISEGVNGVLKQKKGTF